MPRVTSKWQSFLDFINFEHSATHVKQLGLVAIGDI